MAAAVAPHPTTSRLSPALVNRNKLAESGDDSPIEVERAVYTLITDHSVDPFMKQRLLALAAALLLSGCATIVGNETQLVRIDSLPQGARFTVQDERGYAVAQGFTPQTVELEKSTGRYFGKKHYLLMLGFITKRATCRSRCRSRHALTSGICWAISRWVASPAGCWSIPSMVACTTSSRNIRVPL